MGQATVAFAPQGMVSRVVWPASAFIRMPEMKNKSVWNCKKAKASVEEGTNQLLFVPLLSRYKSNKISWLAESIKLSCESDG